MKTTMKIAVIACVLVAATAFIAIGSFKNNVQYYLTVDELLARQAELAGVDIRISGAVVPGSIEVETGKVPAYRFTVSGAEGEMAVSYKGVAPDTFKDSSLVVLRGSLNHSTNVFAANHMLAKCASKYEAKLDEEQESYE